MFVCDFIGAPIGQQGVKGFGSTIDMAMNEACYNGFYVTVKMGTTPPPGTYCSKACVDNSDCAPPFPTCTSSPFQNPSGSGNTFVKTCGS